MHVNDDVEELQAVPADLRRIEAEGRHKKTFHIVDRLSKSRIVQVFEPEIDVLSYDGSALKGRGGQTDDEKRDLAAVQGLKKCGFLSCERRVFLHGSGPF